MNGSKNGKYPALRIASAMALDELVGQHVMREDPSVHWQDVHGVFSFASELEARQALQDPYYQRFLPDVDWSQTVIQEVKTYRPYASDLSSTWLAVERLVPTCGEIRISRDAGRWSASFGERNGAISRSICIAICLAALEAAGCHVEVDGERVI